VVESGTGQRKSEMPRSKAVNDSSKYLCSSRNEAKLMTVCGVAIRSSSSRSYLADEKIEKERREISIR
jgi:hypothetical protein